MLKFYDIKFLCQVTSKERGNMRKLSKWRRRNTKNKWRTIRKVLFQSEMLNSTSKIKTLTKYFWHRANLGFFFIPPWPHLCQKLFKHSLRNMIFSLSTAWKELFLSLVLWCRENNLYAILAYCVFTCQVWRSWLPRFHHARPESQKLVPWPATTSRQGSQAWFFPWTQTHCL